MLAKKGPKSEVDTGTRAAPGLGGRRSGTTALHAQALTIGGGTAAVQRNIIAERALGLPRDAPA